MKDFPTLLVESGSTIYQLGCGIDLVSEFALHEFATALLMELVENGTPNRRRVNFKSDLLLPCGAAVTVDRRLILDDDQMRFDVSIEDALTGVPDGESVRVNVMPASPDLRKLFGPQLICVVLLHHHAMRATPDAEHLLNARSSTPFITRPIQPVKPFEPGQPPQAVLGKWWDPRVDESGNGVKLP